MRQLNQDDEINLLELFLRLWAGKWVITAIVGISLAFGLSFNLYKKKSLPPPHFVVLAPFSINLFSPFDNQICNYNEDMECVYGRVSRELKKLAQDRWSINNPINKEWQTAGFNLEASKPECPSEFCLELNTRSLQDLKFYDDQLQSYNLLLTAALETDINEELLAIYENNTVAQNNSETFAQNFIELKRYLSTIENGAMVVSFGEIKITEVAPPHKQTLILALSFLLGGFLGCAIVLFRAAISSKLNEGV